MTHYPLPSRVVYPKPNIYLGSSTIDVQQTIDSTSEVSNQYIILSNNGQALSTLNWVATHNESWLSIDTTSGSNAVDQTSVLTLSFDTLNFDTTAGIYYDTITITDSNATNNPQTISVTLTLSAASGWVSHFDNSDWQIEDTVGGGLGSWDSGNSEWDSENYSGFAEIIELGELGTWNVDYRPTKMRITYTGASGLAIILTERTNTYIMAEVGEPGVSYPYQSESEITLDWTDDVDMEWLTLFADNGDTFSITNIEFLE